MADKYTAYPEYKDSGIEWLGRIPSSWDTLRHKYIANFKKGKNPTILISEARKNTIKYLSMDYLRGGSEALYAIAEEKSYISTKNQVLIIWDGSNAGEFIKGQYGIVSSTMAASEIFSDINKKYYWYACICIEPEIRRYANGMGIPHVDGNKLKNSNILVPSPEEQQKIANFLDHETAKIDTLIEKQQQLIKLLKEKRQAVISHAVTKGLNPNAPMRDSGVEWLGEVPEHWRIGKLGYFSKISNGATPSRENQNYWKNGTIGWLNSSKVNDVHISIAEQFITPLAVSETSVQPVKKNDLVIAITGEGQTRGRVAICKITATINQHLAAIAITDRSVNYEYLFYWLTSQYERIRFESTGAGSTKGAITRSDIISYPLPIPPAKEQDKIIISIIGTEKKFSLLMKLASDQISLLTERRTSLVSAAVTGKIDLRNWQAPMPHKQESK